MRIAKIFVVFLFALFCLISFQSRFFSPVASGQGSLSAPTGVNATDGIYSTKVGLHWDTMRGATVYRIFRNTVNDPLTATDVGTTAANYFFDASAVQNQIYFYWVRVRKRRQSKRFQRSRTGQTCQRQSRRRSSAACAAARAARKSGHGDQSIARQSSFLGRTAFLDADRRLRNLSFGQRRRH